MNIEDLYKKAKIDKLSIKEIIKELEKAIFPSIKEKKLQELFINKVLEKLEKKEELKVVVKNLENKEEASNNIEINLVWSEEHQSYFLVFPQIEVGTVEAQARNINSQTLNVTSNPQTAAQIFYETIKYAIKTKDVYFLYDFIRHRVSFLKKNKE